MEAIAIERERSFIREFDCNRRAVAVAARSIEAEVINPAAVFESLVDRAVAIDEIRRADALRIEIPAVD